MLGGGDDADNNLLNVRRSESDPIQREESWHSNLQTSSTESINNALTNLGLNWAKSFLKKIEESRAMSSSSCSDEENAELFSMSSTSSLRRKNY